MARHYNKAEILSMMNQVKRQKRVSKTRDIACYSTYANLVASFLYKKYNWTAEQIAEYCNIQTSYYTKFVEDSEQWGIQRKRIEDFMGDKMWQWTDDAVFTEPANISKNKMVNMLNMKMTDINNDYMNEVERYFLAHYNAMIDLGLSAQELYDHWDALDQWRVDYYNAEGNPVIQMHYELVEELGIDIALPTKEDFSRAVCNNSTKAVV